MARTAQMAKQLKKLKFKVCRRNRCRIRLAREATCASSPCAAFVSEATHCCGEIPGWSRPAGRNDEEDRMDH